MNLNLTILGQMISFIFFVGCCMKYVWPPLITTIERRQKKIADDLAYAENLKSKSNVIKQEADEHLRQTQIKVKTLIDQANEYKIKLLNEAKKEAQYEHTKILIKAREEIKLERNQIYEEIRCKLASLIILGVEKIIERSINKDLHDDIINSVINSLHDLN